MRESTAYAVLMNHLLAHAAGEVPEAGRIQ